MKILNKISANGQLQGPGKEIFFGLLKYGTAAACLHGTNVIVHKLIDRGYGATAKIDATELSATVSFSPPPKLQGSLSTGGPVPQQVTTDWNAAVAADSTDNPTNEGVSNSQS